METRSACRHDFSNTTASLHLTFPLLPASAPAAAKTARGGHPTSNRLSASTTSPNWALGLIGQLGITGYSHNAPLRRSRTSESLQVATLTKACSAFDKSHEPSSHVIIQRCSSQFNGLRPHRRFKADQMCLVSFLGPSDGNMDRKWMVASRPLRKRLDQKRHDQQEPPKAGRR